MNIKYKIFAIVLSVIMMGCANSSSSSSEENTEYNRFCDRVAIVDTDVDFYIYYGETEGIRKSPNQLQPGIYPIACKDGDMWSIGVGQDCGYIKTSDCKVETWRAEDGHGYVLPNIGVMAPKIPVRLAPNDNAEVIDSLAFENSIGEPCLGRENGWLKITISKKTGYVKENDATWCIHVFNYSGMIR